MPVKIVSQPAEKSLFSSYQPVLFEVNATTENGDAPSIVFCDVYVGLRYYRTFFATKPAHGSIYVFDIQDALQEDVKFKLPEFGGSRVQRNMLQLVFCKFRTAKANASGFSVSEQAEPFRRTEETMAISGGGVQSNAFYSTGILIQHGENQLLEERLRNFRYGEWNSEALPLSRRNSVQNIQKSQSLHYPIVTSKNITKLKVYYKVKGQRYFRSKTSDVETIGEKPETIGENPNIPNMPGIPPVTSLRWHSAGVENQTEFSYDLKFGEFPPMDIAHYTNDADGDLAKVELFLRLNGGSWDLFGLFSGDKIRISNLDVGNYEFKGIATDAKGQSGESNILKVQVINTAGNAGTGGLTDGETIVISGGQMYDGYGDEYPGFGNMTVYYMTMMSAIADFYEAKGLDSSQLRIQMSDLGGMIEWEYNLVNNNNYGRTIVTPQDLSHFHGRDYRETIFNRDIYHEFEIYHADNPGQKFKNYLMMQFIKV